MSLKRKILDVPGYEKVMEFTDTDVGLRAIVAIHDTRLGPGLGGTRIFPYATEKEALVDVLRLAKGMTYKSGMAQVGLGGAKSIILIDPKVGKSPALLRAFGEAVNSLEGEYICAVDVGCTLDDIACISQTTQYVCGVQGPFGSGDPSIFTAWGVFYGMQALFQYLEGRPSLSGKRVAVQGLGSVGRHLLDRLFWAGAELIISDIDSGLVEKYSRIYSAHAVTPDEIPFVDCDLFAPCALGGVLNASSIRNLRCRGVAGAANSQLLESEDADRLADRGILYAPDFVINAGGLINVTSELSPEGYRAAAARDKTRTIYDELLEVFRLAGENQTSTHREAVNLVDYRLEREIGKRVEPLHFPLAHAF